MADKLELKPCPFCGGRGKYSASFYIFKSRMHNVRCDECGFQSPIYNTKTGAVEAWNRRADNG